MARMRILLVLALAVGLGGTFAYGTYRYIQQLQTPVPGDPVKAATRPVVVAAAPLQLGAEVRADDIRVIEWPADAMPPGAIEKAEEVIGRGLIEGVVESELMLEAKMAPRGAGAGLPPAIPPGMRAVSVRVNEVIGVAGYVLPGTRVDVVVTISPGDAGMTSKIVLTNVLVLTAGTKIERDLENDKPISVTVVTLLVSPTEAERLTLASTEGRIQLALRNPIDQSAPPTPGIRAALLVGNPAAAPRGGARTATTNRSTPPPPPPPPLTIEIIRGDKRVREAVPPPFASDGVWSRAAAPEEAAPASGETVPKELLQFLQLLLPPPKDAAPQNPVTPGVTPQTVVSQE